MGIGVSLFLIAAGAILAFAIEAVFEDVDLVAAGWILMIVGVLGLFVSILRSETFASTRRTRTVVQERPDRSETVYERRDVL